MKIQETRRKVIREWMALPRDKRENKEQTCGLCCEGGTRA